MGIGNKRSVKINGRHTGINLEDAFWKALKEIARARNTFVPQILDEIDQKRAELNLSSATRVFILEYYKYPDRRRQSR